MNTFIFLSFNMEFHMSRKIDISTFVFTFTLHCTTGTPLLDHNNAPIPIAKMLATKPLRSEIHSRKGHGNSKVSYLSTDCVSRTLNDIFGFDGWTSEVLQVTRTLMQQNSKGQWLVIYDAKVRCTHKASGAFKEDIGVADSIHGQIQCAISNAIKAAVSDGLKRAARHFGDKLGNVLYNDKFKAANAPLTLKDALNQYDIERANTKFGFEKDRNHNATNTTVSSNHTNHTETANGAIEKLSTSSVTKSNVPSNQTPVQQTNINSSSSSKIQSSNRSVDPSLVTHGQRPISQHTNTSSSTTIIPTVSVSVSSLGGNTNSVDAPINSTNPNSNGVPRFQRQVSPPNQYTHGHSSSYVSQTSGASIERPPMASAQPPPPFANRSRPEVLNDISGAMNTSHGNTVLSSMPMIDSTNQPSNQDNNAINPNTLNVYSKRKLELSNESASSIGAQKKMNSNPYSKN